MLSQNTQLFCDIRQHLEVIYDDYARSNGISYTTLFILNLVNRYDNCTQKLICDKAQLPKQTVNNAVKKLIKDGLVELSPMENNQKSKKIIFTSAGRAFATPHLNHIAQAENKAMEQFSTSQQELLIQLMQDYDAAFKQAMEQ